MPANRSPSPDPIGKARPILAKIAKGQKYPLLFATVSGAHLYGFPSADSDFDLRGVHLLPAKEVVGLETGEETLEISRVQDDIELDLVTHDVKKFFGLMLKKNGYVLEQLYSPIIVAARPEHEELKKIARGCVTKHHFHHYRGFANTEWGLFSKEQEPRVKPLLYVYRTLMTGIHLMLTGEIECHLPTLNEQFRFPWIDDLIAAKVGGKETGPAEGVDIAFHEKQYLSLQNLLEASSNKSSLPDHPSALKALDALLIRLRLGRPAA